MSLIQEDRVRDTTTSTASPYTITGTPPATYKTFSQVCAASDVFMCAIVHRTLDEWQVGLATFTNSTTITWTTTFNSSNSDSTVTFSAGTKDIVMVQAGMPSASATLDKLVMWDAALTQMMLADLAHIASYATPAPGDFVLVQKSTDELAKVDWGVSNSHKGYIFGLELTNNSTTGIDIAAGECASSGANPFLIQLGAALTNKVLGTAWSVGSGGGGLDTGAVANTTYHCFLIRRPDTGVVDFCFSTSVAAPTFGSNIPSNYTQSRRIGSIVRTGGSIKAFQQNEDVFMWATPVTDVNATNPGTSASTRTLTLPTGVTFNAIVNAEGSNATTSSYGMLSDLAVAAVTPTSTLHNWACQAASQITEGVQLYIRTNTSAQIRSQVSASGASDTFVLITHGWVDTRGRNK